MVSFPHCKINLGLNVIAKRRDGYHDIETCFYPLPWTDVLEIIPSQKFEFAFSGLEIPGKPDDNICIKAYILLQKGYNLAPVKMHLHKIIPTGAGLGGGSSDAAYVLKLLNDIFDLKLTSDQLHAHAAQLGSDCPYFLYHTPKIGKGRGDILENTTDPLKNKFLVLVKPEDHVSTAEAYAGITPCRWERSLPEIILTHDIKDWKELMKNDFEETVFYKYPSIRKLKEEMYSYGAVFSLMSGSGSSVFGIFENEIKAKEVFGEAFCWSGWL